MPYINDEDRCSSNILWCKKNIRDVEKGIRTLQLKVAKQKRNLEYWNARLLEKRVKGNKVSLATVGVKYGTR